jgi:hypothetical protein
MRGVAAAAFAAIASLAIATAALAGGGTTSTRVNPDIQPVTARPVAIPAATLQPIGAATPNGTSPTRRGLPQTRCAGVNWKTLRKGSQVLLSCFPALPAKTVANTGTPRATAKGARYHPLAATGATIDLTAGAGCGTQGALYSVGCSMKWEATNLTDWSTTDLYEDYQLLPNSTTATLVSSLPYLYNGASANTTTLSSAGTYAFFTYDVTAQVIVSIVYVNAGQAFSIGVYQDPYHTSPQYQFNVNTSSAAYIYLPDVSTNDTYVVYVESTSVNTFCVYMTPNSTPAPYSPSPPPTGAPNALICNPANSPGIAAPSGQLSLTWSLSNSYPAGTYSVVVYDKTAGQTLGQVQVSLTGFQQYGFVLFPTPAAAPTPAAPATPASTLFAWDSATDQSTGGIIATVPNQIGNGGASQTYRMTASDPDGQVVFVGNTNAIPSTCTLTNNTATNCTATATFQFSAASPTLNSPGTYPNNIWTMQLYNPTTKTVEASQAFQIMGYSLQTEFVVGGITQQSLTWIVGTSTNLPASMVFKNTGNINYPNAADPVQGIEYTTGPAATLTNAGGFKPPSGTTGYGITAALTGCTGTYNTTGCSKTVVDSAGNSWTVTVYCSTNNVTAPSLTDQCVITLFPQNQATLTASNSITVSGVTFYMQGNSGSWACFAVPCTTTTSILPADGLSWSSTSTTANSWTPVYFDALNASLDVAAQAFYIGAGTFPANTNRKTVTAPFATNPPSPAPNTHYYQSNFAQADYQNSTPFALTAGRDDIMVINLVGCTGAGTPVSGCTSNLQYNAGEVGITFPSSINAANITVDASSPKVPGQNYYYGAPVTTVNTAAGNTCMASLPPNSICLNAGATAPNGTTGANNTTSGIFSGDITQIYLDVPAATSSFTSQEMEIQVWDNGNFGWSGLSTTGYIENPTIGGGAGGPNVDSLSLQAFSLNSNLMAAQFNPSTVSPQGTTTSYSLTFGNTTTAADPNPDPIDAIDIEEATSAAWTISGTPTVTGPTGWEYETTVTNGSTNQYLFGLTACAPGAAGQSATFSAGAQPAQPPTGPTYPTTYQTALGPCTLAQYDNAIAAGGSATLNFTLNNSTTGTETFYIYAHGANGGGWSAPKVVTLTSSAITASAKLFSVAQGATDASCVTTSNVATNTVAQVSKSPNCFIYEVMNTSASGTQNVATTSIALPAFDINGLATNPGDWTLVGSPLNQYVVLGTISGGTFKTTGIPAGCTITLANITNPTPGSTNGAIEVTGCTAFTGGTNIAVEFVANTPSVESDSYLLPTTINGAAAGLAWTGSDEVTVTFSLGLSISVDPANPGPGNSHPNVVCNPAQCTFSGETVNFGEFAANTTITGTDVVRATVIYEGSTVAATCPAGAGVVANTWQLQVTASANATTELNTSVDETNSSANLTYGTGVNTYFEPTTTSTTLACGNYTAGTDYDVLQNFRVENGTDVTGHQVTITYTLIAN